ncbi:MAG TPA: ABC transporter permease [Pyrinomonadaceae bacterium]|nr:ABC transporter permease [Pyrinomonadaceae bacterium]
MRTFLKDVRFGLRVLWKGKGFTAVAVLTLGLGIGVNAAIFSGVSAFVLRPLDGVEEPGRLVSVFENSDGGPGYNNFSYPDLLDYGARTDFFEGLTAHTMVQAAVGERDQTDVIWGQYVTGNFFDVLKVRMQSGRGFLPEEDRTPGTHPVVVLSDALWRERFGADPSIVGRQVQLNGRPLTVVGVASPEFHGAKWALSMKFWVPLMMRQQLSGGTNSWITARGSHWLEVFGRLKPGVTEEQAAAALTSVAARLEAEYPEARNKNVRVLIAEERIGRWSDMAGVVSLSSGLALAMAGLVLLVACANVANMMLARAVARGREIGIRLALGAGRWRVVRQLLTESVILSLAGGAVGLVLSFWMTDALTTFFPKIQYPITVDVSPDRRALLFTAAVSLLTGVVFGLAPAFQSTKPDLVPVLKGESQRSGRARRLSLRNALVVAQVAISLVVLVCAALFVQSFRHAKSIDPGFATDGAFLVSVNPGLFGYEKEQGRDFYRRLAERVRATPGVEAAGFADWLPLGDSSNDWGPIYPAEQPAPPPGEGLNSHAQTVSAGYFKAMRISLVEGRDFDDREREGVKPEALVINETLARRLWPGESSFVGRRMMLGRGENAEALEVVGVVRDSKVRTLGEKQRPLMYVSVDQTYRGGLTLVVRAPGGGEGVVAGVRQAVKEIDARMPLYNVRTIEQHLTWAFWAQSMGASLATAFGLLALALAAVGLYGVVAYTVARRTHEIGIRVALGAQGRDILRIVLGQGMALTLVGLAAGLAGAFALARLLSSLLYGISPGDPATYILVALLLAVVALMACLVPARRATKVDPMVALRYE